MMAGAILYAQNLNTGTSTGIGKRLQGLMKRGSKNHWKLLNGRIQHYEREFGFLLLIHRPQFNQLA